MKTDGRAEGHQHERKFHQPFRLPHNPAEDVRHTELQNPQRWTERRSGEVVYPKHEAGTYESVDSAVDALKARQEEVLTAAANKEGLMPKIAAASEHYRVSKAITEGNVASVEAVTGDNRVTAAKYNDQVKEYKTKRRHEFVNFVGEKTKDLANGTVEVAGKAGEVAVGIVDKSVPVLKKIGEGTIHLAKEGFKAIGAMAVITADVIRRIVKGKQEDNKEKNG
jgi:hypothetical protein